MKLRYWISIGLSFVVIMNVVEVLPESKAPQQERGSLIQASLIDAFSEATPPTPEENILMLNLIDQVIDEERNYEKALEILTEDPPSDQSEILELYSAKIFSRTLEFEKAIDLLQALPTEKTGLLKAIVLIANGSRTDAERVLHELISLNIDAYTTARSLALLNIYHEFDRHKESDRSYLWTLFAQKMGSLQEYEIALYLTEKALEKSPGYRDAWLIRGHSEYQLGQWENAEHSLMSAYNLDPGNAQIQYLLGLVYHQLQAPELSSQYLLYAQQNNSPYQGDILEKLGLNALKQQEYALAKHYFENLLVLTDNHQNALTQLVWITTEGLQNPQEGLQYAERLTNSYPQDANSFQLLSWVQSQLGNIEEANRSLNRANALE